MPAKKTRRQGLKPKQCVVCKLDFATARKHTDTCSDACRKALQRLIDGFLRATRTLGASVITRKVLELHHPDVDKIYVVTEPKDGPTDK